MPDASTTKITRMPRDAYEAFCLARDAHARILGVEPIILREVYYAYMYARDILHARWPEAEPLILRVDETAYKYAEEVIKGRWPEAEEVIINSGRAYVAFFYALKVIKGRFPEMEDVIAGSAWCRAYLISFIREQIIADLSNPNRELNKIDEEFVRQNLAMFNGTVP